MSDDRVDLSPGDFLYQTDKELFHVVMEETQEGYIFSVHGFRDISHDRLKEYLDGEHGKLYRQEQLEKAIEEDGDEDAAENLSQLERIFSTYEDLDLSEDGPQYEFSLEDK